MMGLTVVCETEDGVRLGEVGDPTNVLHKVLPSVDDKRFVLLRFIDLYGDTTFNQLQIGEFINEWKSIKRGTHSREERGLLDRIEKLARQCRDEGPHVYLKFYGD